MIFHTFLVYLQILLQKYGTNQCIIMHWLKHKCLSINFNVAQLAGMLWWVHIFHCVLTCADFSRLHSNFLFNPGIRRRLTGLSWTQGWSRFPYASCLIFLPSPLRKKSSRWLVTQLIPTYQHSKIPTYRRTNIPTRQLTNIPPYRHINISTYQHSNKPTYQHINITT